MLQSRLSQLAQLGAGISSGPAAAFVLSKAARDRLLMHDPACAPLLRPLLQAHRLPRWYAGEASHWLIALPPGWTAARLGHDLDGPAAWQALQARHRALARQLAAAAELATASGVQNEYWWEMPPQPLPPDRELIVWLRRMGELNFALLQNAWPAEQLGWLAGPRWLLGLLNCPQFQPRLRLLAAAEGTELEPAQLAELLVPELAPSQQLQLEQLAAESVALAKAQAQLEQSTCRRIMAEFTPPGALLSPALASWWEMSFADLLQELAEGYASDIPARLRADWQDWFAAQQHAHTGLQAHRAGLEARLALVELAPDERKENDDAD